MHHLINKKLKIYFYFLIFLFLSTFYNPNTQNFSKKIFKIKNIYSKNKYPIPNLDYKNFKRRDDIKIKFNK